MQFYRLGLPYSYAQLLMLLPPTRPYLKDRKMPLLAPYPVALKLLFCLDVQGLLAPLSRPAMTLSDNLFVDRLRNNYLHIKRLLLCLAYLPLQALLLR